MRAGERKAKQAAFYPATIAPRRQRPHIARMAVTVSAEDMEMLAKKVLAGLPAPFRDVCVNVVLMVEDFATPEQLASVGVLDRWELSGLYEGRPLPDQSIWQSGDLPPRVSLFRMPLVAEMRATRVSLEAWVRHVVIHEIGHHFGVSDEDMHALEAMPNRD